MESPHSISWQCHRSRVGKLEHESWSRQLGQFLGGRFLRQGRWNADHHRAFLSCRRFTKRYYDQRGVRCGQCHAPPLPPRPVFELTKRPSSSSHCPGTGMVLCGVRGNSRASCRRAGTGRSMGQGAGRCHPSHHWRETEGSGKGECKGGSKGSESPQEGQGCGHAKGAPASKRCHTCNAWPTSRRTFYWGNSKAHRGDEGEASYPAGGFTGSNRRRSWRWSEHGGSSRHRWRTSGLVIRGDIRLCGGKEAETGFRDSFTTPGTRAGSRRAPPEEEARWRPLPSSGTGGYKRRHYERIEEPPSPTGPCLRTRSGSFEEEREEIQRGEEQQSDRGSFTGPVQHPTPWTRRWGPEEKEEGQEEGQEGRQEEKEEEKIDRGWSDSELQQLLREFLHFEGDRSRGERLGLGDSVSQEKSGVTRFCHGHADEPCPGDSRARSYGGGHAQGPEPSIRGEDPYLLCPAPEAQLWDLPARAPRASSPRCLHGHTTSRRPGKNRRCPSGKVHGTTSVHDRPELAYGEAHGASPDGGEHCSRLLDGAGHTPACQAGTKGAGRANRTGLGWQGPRQGSRRMVPCRRRQRRGEIRERKRQEGARQRKGKGLCSRVGSRKRGLEGEAGKAQRKRFLSRGKPLAEAVEVQCHSSSTVGSVWEIAQHCTDLRKAGCVLAWMIANGEEVSQHALNSRFFKLVFTSDKWLRTGRKRLALPFREGEVADLISVLRTSQIDQVVTEDFVCRWTRKAWIFAGMVVCNALFGYTRPLEKGKETKAERQAILAIGGAVDRLLRHGLVMEPVDPDIGRQMKKRRVNYKGEEMGTCHKLTLAQILPSLPPVSHGGCISAIDWVSPHTRELLLHPGRSILEDDGRPLPKLRGIIHVEPGETEGIAAELVRRGICSWVPLSSVVHYRGQPVLNGMFGVEKGAKLEDQRPVLRLIMNLVSSNSIMRQFTGAVRNLPSITAWMSTVLVDGEEIRIWQSDMCNAFYLFRIPQAWSYYLAFNILEEQKDKITGKPTVMALACNVLPMGWLSSVAIMQEISERILHTKGLDLSSQLARNRPLPAWMVGLVDEAKKEERSWWHVYLDNFAAGQIVGERDTMGAGTNCMYWPKMPGKPLES